MLDPVEMFTCPGKLLFASTFATGVKMAPWQVRGAQINQQIVGTDSETGFTWPDDLPGPNVKGFQPMVAADTKNPDSYTRQSIIPYQDKGNVLYQEVTRDDPNFQAKSRSNYIMDAPVPDQLYMLYEMQLQPNLAEILSAGEKSYNWFQIWETKNAPDGIVDHNQSYRYGVYLIWRKAQQRLEWVVRAQLYPGHETMEEVDWEYKRGTPLPLGEFFRFGVFYRQRPDSEGRLFVHVNDEVICDHRGRTMINDAFADKLNVVKLYTDVGHLEAHNMRVYSMTSSIELWGL